MALQDAIALHIMLPGYVELGHGALGTGHGAWGMGHWARGIGHGALGHWGGGE